MNSLKTLFIVAVLAAVAYGVYVQINRNPQPATGSDSAPPWRAPEVAIPGPPPYGQQPWDDRSGIGQAGTFPPGQMPVAVDGFSASGSPPPAAADPYGRGSTESHPPSALGGDLANTPPARYSLDHPPVAPGNPAAVGTLPSPGGSPVGSNPPLSPGRPDSPGLPSDPPRGSDRAPATPAPARAALAGPPERFASFMQAVQTELDEGRLAEAHQALSSVYDDPSLPVEQDQRVIGLLDQLAGTVIYSRRHLLEPPYKVQPGDTLEQIARTYDVPWQLLARINGVRDPQHLQPGRELKVVRGPFGAVIELDKCELTLMLNGRYAGRFPIGVGSDHAGLEGSYVVCGKNENPQYYGPSMTIGAGDPNNPYGRFWIGLGQQIGQAGRIGIHGTNDPQNLHRAGGPGAICLGDQDIEDVFGILSIGSRVVIRR